MTAEIYTDKQIARGRRIVYRAEAWRRNSPQAYGYAVSMAIDKAARGERISARALIEAVREKDFTDRHGNPTKTNNDYGAVIARWIAIEHPETAPYIERRKTVFDWLVA